MKIEGKRWGNEGVIELAAADSESDKRAMGGRGG